MNIRKKAIVGLIASAGLLANSGASAAAILFAQVQGGAYINDGNQLSAMLTAGGHSVTNVFLNSAVITDFSAYDQVFVYDLSTGANNNTTQAANYTNIANWYNGLTNQNLIADGRIISSAPFWTSRNNMSPEDSWIQNYADQLDLRGGGLVLGTDHANRGQPSGVFVDGINEINRQLDIDPFFSFFGTFPTSQALVDENSPLFVAGLDTCRGTVDEPCINDNSTTSFAPAGLQGNGQVLTPVAYHGISSTAFDNAAVSSTIGSITFGTCDDGSQPPCPVPPPTTPPTASVPEPSILGLMGLGLFGLGMVRRKRS